jgi:hypothetical protein
MAEKKRFKLNGAVVNHCAMDMPMAEKAVDFAIEAIRDQNTEQVGLAVQGLRRLRIARSHGPCLQEIAAAIKTKMEELYAGKYEHVDFFLLLAVAAVACFCPLRVFGVASSQPCRLPLRAVGTFSLAVNLAVL